MAVNLTTGSGKLTPLEKAVKNLGDTVYVGLDKLLQQIANEIYRFAGQYGMDGLLDVVEGSKALTDRERAVFRREVDGYITLQEGAGLYSEELADLFYKAANLSSPTHFQQIILTIRKETEDYFNELNLGLYNAKAAFYNELIYKNNLLGDNSARRQSRLPGYQIELTAETAEAQFQHLLIKDTGALEKLLSAGRERLYRQIEQELQYALIRGDKPEDFLFLLSGRFKAFQESLKTLIVTDGSRIASEMDLKLYELYDVSRYHFAASTDERMCEVCGGLYNESLKSGGLNVNSFAVGISAPPLHPNCRCRTYPDGLKGAETVKQYIHDGDYGPDAGTYIPVRSVSSSGGSRRMSEEDILADPATYYGEEYTALLEELAYALDMTLEELLQDETYRLIIDHIFEGGPPLASEEAILTLAQEKEAWGIDLPKAVQLLRMFDAGYTARILDTRSRYFPGGDISRILRLVSRLYPEREFYMETLPAKYLDALELLILGHERYNINPEAIGWIIEAARQELATLMSSDPELMTILDKLISGPVTLKDAYALYDKMLEVFEMPRPEDRDSTIAKNTEAMNIVFLTDPANAYLTYEQRLAVLALFQADRPNEAKALIRQYGGEGSQIAQTQMSFTGSRDYMDMDSFIGALMMGATLDTAGNIMQYSMSYQAYYNTLDNLNRLNRTDEIKDITTESPYDSYVIRNERFNGAYKLNDDGLPINSKITGWTKHGTEQALGRDGGRGVSNDAIVDAVEKPLKTTNQAGGTIKYTGKDATVVLNREGKVVTTWANGSAGLRGGK